LHAQLVVEDVAHRDQVARAGLARLHLDEPLEDLDGASPLARGGVDLEDLVQGDGVVGLDGQHLEVGVERGA